MTLFRTAAILALSTATLAFGGVASAQISTGTEYRQAYDTATDSFGEDYSSQQRAAQENRDESRVMSKTATRYISAAMKAAQDGDYDEMISQTRKGLKKNNLTPYEESLLYQLNAAGSLKAKDLTAAKESYKAALATGGMNDAETTKVNATLATINAASAN